MTHWKDYHLPASVEEALALLDRYQGRGRVVGGGTDLILDLQDGRHPPLDALVDVTRIPELTRIEQRGDLIYVGAAVTHSDIEASPLLREQATCLVESCGVVGGPQVRNVATIGGNVAHALPAADGTVSLMALEAEALVARRQVDGSARRAWHPLPELFLGPGRPAIDPGCELLVTFRFPALVARAASAFQRIMRPQGVALPILGVAACVHLSPDLGHFEEARIAVGPAGPVPFRAKEAEAVLHNAACDSPEVVDEAVAAALAAARLRTSRHRATAEYRREMLDLLLRRVIGKAVARAQSA